MSNEREKSIPRYAYDGAMMVFNKTIHRLWITCVLLIVLLVSTNIAWLIYESQFEETTTKIEQEAEWDSESEVIMNGTGTINYGESKADDNNKDTQVEDRR